MGSILWPELSSVECDVRHGIQCHSQQTDQFDISLLTREVDAQKCVNARQANFLVFVVFHCPSRTNVSEQQLLC